MIAYYYYHAGNAAYVNKITFFMYLVMLFSIFPTSSVKIIHILMAVLKGIFDRNALKSSHLKLYAMESNIYHFIYIRNYIMFYI